MAGNDWKWPVFKKRAFWTLQVISGWLFTHQQVVSGPLYDIIKAQRRRICQNSKKFDPKIFFLKFFLKIFFWKFFLKFFFLWFIKMSYFLPIWVVFWYIQGTEVELGVINSTSAPCTHQNNFFQVYLEWNIDIALSKNQKCTTKQKFKISQKLNFYKRSHFRSFPVTSGRIFLHQKIVSSL